MNRQMTRRRLVTAAGGALAAVSVPAQTPAPAQTELARAAREQNQRAGETLAKFGIPLNTEPAFQFKA